MSNNLAIFAINHHYAPSFVSRDISRSFCDSVIGFLDINIRNTSCVKILYFIIGSVPFFNHLGESTLNGIIKKANMRDEHENNAFSFHEKESRAVLTITHHKAIL